jgi:hypothetical protein
MANPIRAQLEQAHKLIEQDRLGDAVTLLNQITARAPENVDAWWMLANAYSEPADAYVALNNVLNLNPGHEEAREAYEQLVAEFPHLAGGEMPDEAALAPDSFSPDITVDIDELLIKTGTLDPHRNNPLNRPDDAMDSSSAYLDDLWTDRNAGGTQSLSLDDMFAKDETLIPSQDDAMLSQMFGVTEVEKRGPRSSGRMKSPPRDGGDLFSEPGKGSGPKSQGRGAKVPTSNIFGTPPAPPKSQGRGKQTSNLSEDVFGAPATPAGPKSQGRGKPAPPPSDDLFANFTLAPSIGGDDKFLTEFDPADDAKLDADLEAFFGNNPAAANLDFSVEDDNDAIDAMFSQPSSSKPAPAPAAAPAPTDDLDDLFGEPTSPIAVPVAQSRPAPAPAPAAADDLDALFDEQPTMMMPAAPASATASAAVADDDMDALFAEPAPAAKTGSLKPANDPFDEAFAQTEPSFLSQSEQSQPEAKPEKRGRRGKDKQNQPAEAAPAVGYTDAPPPADTLAPPRREKPAKPIVIEEEVAADPFADERRTNRRSPLRVIAPLVSLLVIIGGAVALFLYLQQPTPAPADPVVTAMQAASDDLTQIGFSTAQASRTGGVVALSVCGTAGPDLPNQIWTAMDLIARRAAPLRDSIQTVQILVVACAETNVVLYRAAAPISAVTAYIDGNGQDVQTYRANWQQN